MDSIEDYEKEYNNLKDFNEYKEYIDLIENSKKYLEKEVFGPLKIMIVNASKNQGQFKNKILMVLKKKIEAISQEIENIKKTVGAIYKIDENEEYGGRKPPRNSKTLRFKMRKSNKKKTRRVKKY
jgi:hypothetical protein